MRAIDRLLRDHEILRSKLDVLESALTMGANAWFVLREVCFTLSRQLRDHIKREEELVLVCRQAMNPKVLAEVSVEHHDEPAHLRSINRLFVQEHSHDLARIRPALIEVIEGLRRHMAEEEAELFPILERVLGAQEVLDSPKQEPSAPIDETMTVNRIVHLFPRTKPVFERLFVNVPMEGCDCLDEVAWRHGMDSRELLGDLEKVIRSCQCRDHPASTKRDEVKELVG